VSAFYDILIGAEVNSEPQERRLENEKWEKNASFGMHSWLSLPGNKNYIKQFSNEIADIIVIGQFYEHVEIESLLNNCLHYIDKETTSFIEPAGHYILLVFYKLKKEYHIFTNRLGTYHAYYSSIGGQNILSTYFLGLARQAQIKNLDWEGITGFMATGFFPGNTTYLEGISILEPASHYVFDAGLDMVSHKRYWDWIYEPVPREASTLFEEFDSILADSLSYAVQNKRVALPISGGLDSRTLAGIITAHKFDYRSLWSFSYGFTDKSHETKIASKIATARGVDFNRYTVPDYLFDKIDLIADSVELFQYIDGTRQAAMNNILEGKCDTIIGGHWGDVWLDDAGVESLTEEEYYNKKVIKRGSNWLLSEVCKPYYPNYEIFLGNYFNNWSHKYKNIENKDFRIKIFKTDQWSFRWTVPSLRMYQAAVMPVLPFYDKRLVDFFTTVDVSVLKNRNFQVAYLKKYHSDLAKIKWQEYDSNLYNYKKYNNRNLVYRAVNKVKTIVLNQKPVIRNWELFYLNTTGKEKLENILLHNKAFNEIVPVATAQQLFTDFYNYPNASNGYRISMLHTFAQFMKKVF
jgi:hypothetical protein